MPEGKSLPVEFDELLAAEFNYIAQTAIQANEDRARVSSFYLIAVGSLVAAIVGAQYIDPSLITVDPNILFSGLFILLTLLGTSTVMQLARLRLAWYESAMAMNRIKDYMMSKDKTLVDAFRWTTNTLPPKFKKDSVSYYQAIEVALISGLMFGTAVFFLQNVILPAGSLQFLLPVVAGILTTYVQVRLYRQALR